MLVRPIRWTRMKTSRRSSNCAGAWYSMFNARRTRSPSKSTYSSPRCRKYSTRATSKYEQDDRERDDRVLRADANRVGRLDLVRPVVGLGARVRLEVACRLHDPRLSDRRERRAGHERVDEPLAVRGMEVHVEQDLAQLPLVLGRRREDQLDRQLVRRAVRERP